MNLQEIFDVGVRGVLKQGRPSRNESGCLYDGPNDCHCLIGWIIPKGMNFPDSRGNPRIADDTPLTEIVVRLHAAGVVDSDVSYYTLNSFQCCHDAPSDPHEDYNDPAVCADYLEEFRTACRTFADEWNLSPAVLNEVTL